MELQRLYSYVRQAIDRYGMIEGGDKIAIGLSGGKDSVALLAALSGLQKFYPKAFQIVAITVDLGLGNMEFSKMEQYCQQLGVEYHIVKTQIYDIVFQERKEKHPCSLCAKLRKGALNTKAMELGCNKIAYAHHRDDFVDTFFLSLMQEGRIHSLSPMYTLDKTGLTLIRPLFLVPEAKIIGFQKKYQLPVIKNMCPADGATKRKEMKEQIHILEREQRNLRNKVFTAIQHAGFEDWPKDTNERKGR